METNAIHIINRFEPRRKNLIHIFHAVQEEFGYIPAEAIMDVADFLGVSEVELYLDLSVFELDRHSTPLPNGQPDQLGNGVAAEETRPSLGTEHQQPRDAERHRNRKHSPRHRIQRLDVDRDSIREPEPMEFRFGHHASCKFSTGW